MLKEEDFASYLNRLDLMMFNKKRCQVLHLVLNNSMQHYSIEEEWLKSCPAEKNLRALVSSWLISQLCAQVANKPNGILACIRSRVAAGLGKGLCLKHCFQFCTSHNKKDIELLEHVQRSAVKLRKSEEDKWSSRENLSCLFWRTGEYSCQLQ